jgi:plastocyanin
MADSLYVDNSILWEEKMSKIHFLLILTALLVLLTACSSRSPESTAIRVEMSEYAFSPEVIEVKAGQQVVLELVNLGIIPHELMFGRDVNLVDHRPSGFKQDMFEETQISPVVVGGNGSRVKEHSGAHSSGHEGFMVMLEQNGDTATISFTATKDMVGEWEIGCFEQEGVHYDAGMKGKFIVRQ